jgi:hypothetical protein
MAVFAMGSAHAQQQAKTPSLGYDFVELRFVDVDVAGGDGLKLGGSYHIKNNWLIVGSLSSVSFDNNIDSRTIEIGAGWVWPWQKDWDLVASARFVDIGGDFDENGVILEGGLRGLLMPQFELRGSVNHITAGDNDTFLEFGGDYYFTKQFAAGLTLEFAGDVDVFTVGARYFFR